MSNYNELDDSVKLILENALSPHKVSGTIKLKGDASYRSYYRITTESSDKTFILMRWNPELTNKSEEATKNLFIKESPFINILKYLKKINIPVPEIIYHNIDVGMIILEDLGDTTLERAFSSRNDFSLYEKAIKLLALLKTRTLEKPDKNCIAFLRKFDYDLYMWEFDHFIEYGIEARNNIKLPEPDKNLIRNYFSKISYELEKFSFLFTHRDYQSRNIMIRDGNYYLIDFQDALISTPTYDLVALLRDSYIRFEEKIVNDFIELYIASLNSNILKVDEAEFKRLFYLQTIQRKLKDGGRFVFIDMVKGNPSFLPYIPNSFTYARDAINKFNEFKELHKTIAKYVPEFQ
ncbi:MAG: aminoglycoside phosphotransferase family protein [Myxococcota bacterium]